MTSKITLDHTGEDMEIRRLTRKVDTLERENNFLRQQLEIARARSAEGFGRKGGEYYVANTTADERQERARKMCQAQLEGLTPEQVSQRMRDMAKARWRDR